MRVRSKIAALAGTVMVATTLVAGATPASAASVCGSGYTKVGSYAIPKTGVRMGTLEVYYSSRTGKNCALAVGYGKNYGLRGVKGVYIDYAGQTGNRWKRHDSGSFKYYAGPVYLSARGRCIDVQGVVYNGINRTSRNLNSVHCG